MLVIIVTVMIIDYGAAIMVFIFVAFVLAIISMVVFVAVLFIMILLPSFMIKTIHLL